MPPLFMIAFVILLILVEAPILLLHEWNHDHRPSVFLSTKGLTGPVGSVLSGDTIEALLHYHGGLSREIGCSSEPSTRP